MHRMRDFTAEVEVEVEVEIARDIQAKLSVHGFCTHARAATEIEIVVLQGEEKGVAKRGWQQQLNASVGTLKRC